MILLEVKFSDIDRAYYSHDYSSYLYNDLYYISNRCKDDITLNIQESSSKRMSIAFRNKVILDDGTEFSYPEVISALIRSIRCKVRRDDFIIYTTDKYIRNTSLDSILHALEYGTTSTPSYGIIHSSVNPIRENLLGYLYTVVEEVLTNDTKTL